MYNYIYLYLYIYLYIYIHMYIFIHLHTYVYIYILLYPDYCIVSSFPNIVRNQCTCWGGTVLWKLLL